MTKCACGAEMRPLFSSMYCVAECDRPSTSTAVAAGKKVGAFHHFGHVWDVYAIDQRDVRRGDRCWWSCLKSLETCMASESASYNPTMTYEARAGGPPGWDALRDGHASVGSPDALRVPGVLPFGGVLWRFVRRS